MSGSEERGRGPGPSHRTEIGQLRTGAEELLVRIQANLDLLDDGSERTHLIVRDLRMLIDEVRRALS